jgi:hypothetical protein
MWYCGLTIRGWLYNNCLRAWNDLELTGLRKLLHGFSLIRGTTQIALACSQIILNAVDNVCTSRVDDDDEDDQCFRDPVRCFSDPETTVGSVRAVLNFTTQ